MAAVIVPKELKEGEKDGFHETSSYMTRLLFPLVREKKKKKTLVQCYFLIRENFYPCIMSAESITHTVVWGCFKMFRLSVVRSRWFQRDGGEKCAS